MNRFALPLALAAVSVVAAFSAGESFAKSKAAAPDAPAKVRDASCKQSRWELKGAGSKTIVEGSQDRVWRVSITGVPAKASVVLEYTRANGTKGEVGMPSGYATLVEGSSVRMILTGAAASVAGTINAQC
ncbi:hypothetical protein [Kaistia terrae]|uniref:Secreted protein n=1 Tax=Kaistia terrae TaxID=537017 RepID=A0ABW0PYF1_9HYPH|nr:hypothetical protein [Kaistia terrae]MCX5580862.1 hypothetical protein [Kaistia terrae]